MHLNVYLIYILVNSKEKPHKILSVISGNVSDIPLELLHATYAYEKYQCQANGWEQSVSFCSTPLRTLLIKKYMKKFVQHFK